MRNFLVILFIILSVSAFGQRKKGLASGTTTNRQVQAHKDVFQRKARRQQNVYIGHLPFMYHFSSEKRYNYRYNKKSSNKSFKLFTQRRRYKSRVKHSRHSKDNNTKAPTTGGARRKQK